MAEIIGQNKTPWWFWLVSGAALLWNLMGVGAFFYDLNMSHEDMVQNYGQAMADAAASQPGFVTVAYGLAVFGGAIGCLLLLLRKKAAIWPLILSLICVIIQQAYTRFATDIMSTMDGANKGMYLSIVIVAVVLFARHMINKGILR